jgi:hypothetical protein
MSQARAWDERRGGIRNRYEQEYNVQVEPPALHI